jgi:hypothetical protein
MLTQSREAIAWSVGEEDWVYADFDPPDLEDDQDILDGRTIDSAGTPTIMDDQAGTISEVTVVSAPVTINGVLIEANTGVRFKVAGLQVRTDGAETVVKVPVTLSDGAKKALGVRFRVEA